MNNASAVTLGHSVLGESGAALTMRTQSLTPKRVRQSIDSDTSGFYRLGTELNGQFHMAYFGRSDTCLQRRLVQHARKDVYEHYQAMETESVYEAFRLECREWHLPVMPTDNKYHPATPGDMDMGCPYCQLAEQVSVQKQLRPTELEIEIQ